MAGRKSRGPSFNDLVDEALRKKNYRPVYILVGEDEYRAEQVVHRLRDDVLGPEGVAFNFHSVHGDQATINSVLQLARGFPMLGNKLIVWLRQADKVVHDKQSELAFEKYLEDPPDTTILILTAPKIDGRRGWIKKCRKAGFVFDFSPPGGDELVDWLRKAGSKAGLAIQREACELLVDLIGDDLHGLMAEVDKLAIAVGNKTETVTLDTIAQTVMDQGHFEDYALSNAVGRGDRAEALQVWRRMTGWGHTAHGSAPLLIFKARQMADIDGRLTSGDSAGDIASNLGIHPWVVKKQLGEIRRLGSEGIRRLLDACKECDSALKTSSMPPNIAMEKLIISFCR